MAHLNADHENDAEVSTVFSQHAMSGRSTAGATGTFIPAPLPASLIQPNLVSALFCVRIRLTRAASGRLCSAMGQFAEKFCGF